MLWHIFCIALFRGLTLMLDKEDKNAMRVADDIQKYLQYHPNAADTLEGITKWWVSQICVEEAVEVIAKALEILERQGKVTKTVMVGGKEIYSRSKLHESEWLIDKDERV